MTAPETPDELRARAERSTTALRQAPAVGPLETIMMTPESANGLADLIDALLAQLTAAEDVPQRLHDFAVAEGRRLRDVYVTELRQERDDLAARLTAAEAELAGLRAYLRQRPE